MFYFCLALKNLKNASTVEKLRDRVYSLLENHCRLSYPDKTTRFAKLLVRLPALRSIGLKCIEHLFFQQFLTENNLKQNIGKKTFHKTSVSFIYSKFKFSNPYR